MLSGFLILNATQPFKFYNRNHVTLLTATMNNLAFLLPAEYEEESTTANTIYYPALPLDQSGERNGSSTTLYSNEQPPSSSYPSGYGQSLAEAHGTGMTSIPNIPAGNTPIPEHLQPSHAGTNLSSAGPGYTVNFQRLVYSKVICELTLNHL